MISRQEKLKLSPYMKIYDIVVPQNHLLRQINDIVDFSFVYDELSDKYCTTNGRNAIDPVIMFKYLLLKVIYNLSDVDVVEHSRYDMSYKYFLGLCPEDDVINASSLTKFRKLRLKDLNLLDMLIHKTIAVALENGITLSNTVMIDATHTEARYRKVRIKEMLQKQASVVYKEALNLDKEFGEKVPELKTSHMRHTEDVKQYCDTLISMLKKTSNDKYPTVKEATNLLQEMLDDHVDTFDYSYDTEARVGHKSTEKSFYGYKTHIAMTTDRIITAATVTSGEANDGKELSRLLDQTINNGIKVEQLVGDMAYGTRANIDLCKEKNIELISPMHPTVINGTRTEKSAFSYNKDAGTMTCPAGHLATHCYREHRPNNKYKSDRDRYMFDVEKCKCCPKREGCYNGAKTKSYSITIKQDIINEREELQHSEHFKEIFRDRYMIEAKNSELKNQHGYDKAETAGLVGMQLQGAVSIFAVNIKRIIKLISEK